MDDYGKHERSAWTKMRKLGVSNTVFMPIFKVSKVDKRKGRQKAREESGAFAGYLSADAWHREEGDVSTRSKRPTRMVGYR